MNAKTEPILIYCAFGELLNAQQTARLIIEARLAGCVNVLPGIRSYYEWEGRLEESEEVLLLAKTTKNLEEQLTRFIIKHHTYDEPGVVSLPIAGGSQSYLDWIIQQTQSKPLAR